eukprot:gene23412-biopygen8861
MWSQPGVAVTVGTFKGASQGSLQGSEDSSAGVAWAWRGHGAGVARAMSIFFGLGWRGRGAGMARAWRGHVL